MWGRATRFPLQLELGSKTTPLEIVIRRERRMASCVLGDICARCVEYIVLQDEKCVDCVCGVYNTVAPRQHIA